MHPQATRSLVSSSADTTTKLQHLVRGVALLCGGMQQVPAAEATWLWRYAWNLGLECAGREEKAEAAACFQVVLDTLASTSEAGDGMVLQVSGRLWEGRLLWQRCSEG
jgi:hypothetical protein